MELLDLPPELFRLIIHFTVADTDARAACKLRRVHRAFASEIFEEVVTNTPHEALPDRLFEAHGGTIIYSRLSKSPGHYLVFVKPLLDTLVRRNGTVSKEQEERYTRAICQSTMGGHGPDSNLLHDLSITDSDAPCNHIRDRQRCLIAAAAVDDVKLISSLDLSADEVFKVNHAYLCTFYPTAFEAAMATDSFRVLEWLLESHWARDSRYAEHLALVLSAAARLAKNRAGNMIASSMVSRHSIGLSEAWAEDGVHTAIEVGNGSFLLDLLRFRAYTQRSNLAGWPNIDICDLDTMFGIGSLRTLKYLIEVGAVSASRMGQHLLLGHAMRFCRYDIARMLLNMGADINARDAQGRTVLYKEAWAGNIKHVMLLIAYGADPAGISEHLCQMAFRHANGKQLDSDAWLAFWDASDDDRVLRNRPEYHFAREQMEFE